MINNFLEIVIFVAGLISVIYAFGVVWRVEKKLDFAFKLFLGAIISFVISELISLLVFEGRMWAINGTIVFKTIFALLFLGAMAEMRSMLRKLDGEKK